MNFANIKIYLKSHSEKKKNLNLELSLIMLDQ